MTHKREKLVRGLVVMHGRNEPTSRIEDPNVDLGIDPGKLFNSFFNIRQLTITEGILHTNLKASSQQHRFSLDAAP